MNKFPREEYLNEICGHCGFTYGSHHAGIPPYPRDYCPGNERQMDWEDGPGTCFISTGKYRTNPEKPS